MKTSLLSRGLSSSLCVKNILARRVSLYSPMLYRTLKTHAQNATAEVPLHYYQAQEFATKSINHRMFYVNWIAVIFCIDAAKAMIDL